MREKIYVKSGIELVVLALLFMPFLRETAFCGDTYLGYTGYIQGSSKVIGMAGAFTGIADDTNSIIYNPAGSVFTEFRNLASINHVRFTDKSLDLDKNSSDDIWKSEAFTFGFLHRTKKQNKFTWGICPYNFYKLVFTNDIAEKDKFILQLGEPGEGYDMEFSLGGLLIPLIWQLNEKLSFGMNVRIHSAQLTYDEETSSGKNSVFQKKDRLLFDLSTMYKLKDNVMFGALIRPPVYFNFDETMNEELEGFNWFHDISTPLEINIGLGYKRSDILTFGVDLHYAHFKGDEILVGSSLIPEFSEYKLKTKSILTPHIGSQYRAIFLNRDLFFRIGYYYQPNLFKGLSPKNHFTFSISWRVIKLPKYFLAKYISLGYSKDIADKYDVNSFTLESAF